MIRLTRWLLLLHIQTMISYIKGKLVEKNPTNIVVEAQSVGYEVHIPLSTYSRLPNVKDIVELKIYLHIREDGWQLFGFSSREEKELFKLLISISGIGPKVALTVLSGIGIDNFKEAIVGRDIAMLTSISGIGRKTAERMLVELKEKVTVSKDVVSVGTLDVVEKDDVTKDAITALLSLGYKEKQAQEAITQAIKKEGREGATVEKLIRFALMYV